MAWIKLFNFYFFIFPFFLWSQPKSIRMYDEKGNSSNTLFLGSATPLFFSLDIFDLSPGFLSYTLKHYDPFWNAPSPLFSGDISREIFFDFKKNERIVTVDTSYNHLCLQLFPFGYSPQVTGNFLLTLQKDKETLIQKRVFVVRPEHELELVDFSQKNLWAKNVWEIKAHLKKNIRYQDGQWILLFLQNFRDDDITYFSRPIFFSEKELTYQIPNPLKSSSLSLKVNTEEGFIRVEGRKKVFEYTLFTPTLMQLNPFTTAYTWQPLSSEYLYLRLKIDFPFTREPPFQKIFLLSEDNGFLKTDSLMPLKEKPARYTGNLYKKRGIYQFWLTDEKGNPIIPPNSTSAFHEETYQFFLYFKKNGQRYYEIVGYRKYQL